MPILDLAGAVALARTVHEGQTDKAGYPYFDHPLSVMEMLLGEDEEVLTIAILHDAVEDTDLTLERLRELGASDRVIAGIDSVTRRDGETYMDLIRRAHANPDGRKVKLADNLHNTMRLRNLGIDERVRLVKKYRKAREVLLA